MRSIGTRNALEKVYKTKREETLQKIECAISEFRTTGERLTISTLVKYTGLSNAVFYKPHVQKLLNNEPEFRKSQSNKSDENTIVLLEKANHSIVRQLELEKSKREDLTLVITRKDKTINSLEQQVRELTEELERLRGKYHALHEKVDQTLGFKKLDIEVQ